MLFLCLTISSEIQMKHFIDRNHTPVQLNFAEFLLSHVFFNGSGQRIQTVQPLQRRQTTLPFFDLFCSYLCE